MKNIILVHMESLNEIVYRLNGELFPNLRSIERQSIQFSNYYSSATSTLMTILDLMMGFDPSFEKCDYLENIFVGQKKSKESLFDCLYENNYYCKSFFLNTDKGDVQILDDLNRIICENGEYWEGEGLQDFSDNFIETVRCHDDKPFAFFVIDNFSHIAYHSLGQVDNTKTVSKWFSNRYMNIDETFGRIFELLDLINKKENTIVLLYGDHGEEYWVHGLYEGYTHAIEPFTSITRCPLFLYDEGNNQGKINGSLISTVDLKDIILNRLGIISTISSNRFVYSRNLFAYQTRRSEVFHKSYSVTDGEFTLLLTSKGYSMYMNRLDPGNQCNILNFFKLKDEILIYKRQYDMMISSHYKSFMTSIAVENIVQEFYTLKDQLNDYIFVKIGVPADFVKHTINYSLNNESKRFKRRYIKNQLKKVLKERYIGL